MLRVFSYAFGFSGFMFLNLFYTNLSTIVMCVLLQLLICTALRARIIVAGALYKIVIIIINVNFIFLR